nr:DUF1292 domain-containing protein [Maliibacterium massiliense]
MMESNTVVLTGDDGSQIELDVIDMFFHEGQQYAVLIDALSPDEAEALAEGDGDEHDEACGCDACAHEHDEDCGCDACAHEHGEGCGCEEGVDAYIMRVVTEGDEEQFLPIDPDKFEEIAAICEQRMMMEDDEEDGIDIE